jgi:hypothetical protein
MPELELRIRCQRCGDQMEMKEPAPGQPWRPDQFWVCPRCGRHFWSTYASPPAPATAAAAPQAAGQPAEAPKA